MERISFALNQEEVSRSHLFETRIAGFDAHASILAKTPANDDPVTSEEDSLESRIERYIQPDIDMITEMKIDGLVKAIAASVAAGFFGEPQFIYAIAPFILGRGTKREDTRLGAKGNKSSLDYLRTIAVQLTTIVIISKAIEAYGQSGAAVGVALFLLGYFLPPYLGRATRDVLIPIEDGITATFGGNTTEERVRNMWRQHLAERT